VLLADAGAARAGAGRSGLLESCKGLPVVLMAADAAPCDVMRGVALGAVDFLAKPASQLKLQNIWQHTVRRMMGGSAAAAPPAAAPALDRSASNTEALAAAADAGAAAGPKPPAGLPPRSPPLRARRHGAGAGRALHACISSTNLAAGSPASDEDDFDFGAAAEDAAAPAPAPSAPAAPAPLPSTGVPAHGPAAALPSGMVWGMPMPVVRAPGIVPPRGAAPSVAATAAPPAWGYMGCAMPPPGFMAPPPFMMGPPPMCGPPPAFFGPPAGAAYGPPPAFAAPQPAPAPPAPQATGAAAAQALEASLMTLLGSAEDDDLDVDFDDVLGDLAATGPAAAAAAAACCPPPAAAPSDSCGGGAACSDGSDGDAATLLRCSSAADVSPRGSFESRRAPEPAPGCGDELDALFAAGGPGLGLDDAWEAGALPSLKKSGSLADLLATMA
jgi:CheY-like chemotaxis protein